MNVMMMPVTMPMLMLVPMLMSMFMFMPMRILVPIPPMSIVDIFHNLNI